MPYILISLGIFIQSIIFLVKSKNYKSFSIALLILIFSISFFLLLTIPSYIYGIQNGYDQNNESLINLILLPFIIYAFSFAFLFRKWILPKVTYLTILISTFLFIYALFKYGLSNIGLFGALIVGISILTIYSFLKYSRTLNNKKILLYVWYLLSTSFLILFQFKEIVSSLTHSEVTSPGVNLGFIFFGMAAFYLISYYVFIMTNHYEHTNEQNQSKKSIFESYSQNVLESFSKNYYSKQVMILVAMCISIILVVNLKFSIISDLLIINAFLLFALFSPINLKISEITKSLHNQPQG